MKMKIETYNSNINFIRIRICEKSFSHTENRIFRSWFNVFPPWGNGSWVNCDWAGARGQDSVCERWPERHRLEIVLVFPVAGDEFRWRWLVGAGWNKCWWKWQRNPDRLIVISAYFGMRKYNVQSLLWLLFFVLFLYICKNFFVFVF